MSSSRKAKSKMVVPKHALPGTYNQHHTYAYCNYFNKSQAELIPFSLKILSIKQVATGIICLSGHFAVFCHVL